jgi:hypothetical protein
MIRQIWLGGVRIGWLARVRFHAGRRSERTQEDGARRERTLLRNHLVCRHLRAAMVYPEVDRRMVVIPVFSGNRRLPNGLRLQFIRNVLRRRRRCEGRLFDQVHS